MGTPDLICCRYVCDVLKISDSGQTFNIRQPGEIIGPEEVQMS